MTAEPTAIRICTWLSQLLDEALPLTVEEFLEQLKFQRYWNVFKDNGFEELALLKYLDANALNKMDVLQAPGEDARDYTHTVGINQCDVVCEYTFVTINYDCLVLMWFTFNF